MKLRLVKEINDSNWTEKKIEKELDRLVENVAPAQRSESASPTPPAAVEPRPEQEGSDTDDVREALRDIRPR